jgi:hypothetical protein
MCILSVAVLCTAIQTAAAFSEPEIKIEWNSVQGVNRTNASVQAVVTPLMLRGSPMHDRVWQAFKDLEVEHVRYLPWLPYPRLAVADLEPPAGGRTSWNFSLINPFTIDFLQATKGHSVMLNVNVIP